MPSSLLQAYRTAFNGCDYNITHHHSVPLKASLQALADHCGEDEQADTYGKGKLIEDFEQEVADLLGKDAAIFLPSGSIAQPLALRIWADRARTDYVALPATSHLVLHEHNSYQILYRLKGVMLGEAHRVPQLADLEAAALDPLAAILLELPMREIGGQLPAWYDLVNQSRWAGDNGIKLHMDGARLWQCPAAYGKGLAEIADLFDSVYVSFYKDLGGIAGAILAGDKDFIASAKVWQRRAGANLHALYPYVLAARDGLRRHLPAMEKYREDARWLAAQLNQWPNLSTWPQESQTNMFRLRISCQPEQFLARGEAWMKQHGVSIITPPYQIDPDAVHCELTIGNAFGVLDRSEWAGWIQRFGADVLGATDDT